MNDAEMLGLVALPPDGLFLKDNVGRLWIRFETKLYPLDDPDKLDDHDRPMTTVPPEFAAFSGVTDDPQGTPASLCHDTASPGDQGGRRTCVCFAVLAAMELRLARAGQARVALSVQYANWVVMQELHPPQNWCQSGSRLADGMYALSRRDVCEASLCAYSETSEMDCARGPDPRARDAARYRVERFCFIADKGKGTPESIKNPAYLRSILASGYDIVLAFEPALMYGVGGIYDVFYTSQRTPSRAPGGGHAVLVVGYDRRGDTRYFICKDCRTGGQHNGYLWLSDAFVREYAYYGAVVLDVSVAA